MEFVYFDFLRNLIFIFHSEGLSNLIFFVGLPPNIKTHDREPRQVLLRIFGNTLMPLEQETPESFITGIVTENVIFAILSERKLGPRLMGVFAGGRLEEYIPVILKRFTHCLKITPKVSFYRPNPCPVANSAKKPLAMPFPEKWPVFTN